MTIHPNFVAFNKRQNHIDLPKTFKGRPSLLLECMVKGIETNMRRVGTFVDMRVFHTGHLESVTSFATGKEEERILCCACAATCAISEITGVPLLKGMTLKEVAVWSSHTKKIAEFNDEVYQDAAALHWQQVGDFEMLVDAIRQGCCILEFMEYCGVPKKELNSWIEAGVVNITTMDHTLKTTYEDHMKTNPDRQFQKEVLHELKLQFPWSIQTNAVRVQAPERQKCYQYLTRLRTADVIDHEEIEFIRKHIYPSYRKELRKVRKAIKAMKALGR
jgi:hypothetical protein